MRDLCTRHELLVRFLCNLQFYDLSLFSYCSQKRITGTCTSTQSIISIATDGTVTCTTPYALDFSVVQVSSCVSCVKMSFFYLTAGYSFCRNVLPRFVRAINLRPACSRTAHWCVRQPGRTLFTRTQVKAGLHRRKHLCSLVLAWYTACSTAIHKPCRKHSLALSLTASFLFQCASGL